MALIRKLKQKNIDRGSLHAEISAEYAVIERDGRKLLQIDTYGRATRQNPGKQSQTLQFDEIGAKALHDILVREFGF